VKAFVLAGGMGTRLKPRFGDLPKPLAPLRGRPFLLRQLEALAAAGVRHAVVLAGFGADQVRAALASASLRLRVDVVVEPEPLGTAGALAHARAYVGNDSIVVVNGDTLADCDPWRLEQRRWERGALGAVALFRVEDAASRGRVECDASMTVRAFVEKDPAYRGGAWVNGGMYAFSPHFWRRLPGAPASLERDVLPALAAEGQLLGLACAGRFWDIGTPEDHARAERELPA
jgi:NDP-sugar pyrophosphorylase family protein